MLSKLSTNYICHRKISYIVSPYLFWIRKPCDSFLSFDNALIKLSCLDPILSVSNFFIIAQISNLLPALIILFPAHEVFQRCISPFINKNCYCNINQVKCINNKCKGKGALNRKNEGNLQLNILCSRSYSRSLVSQNFTRFKEFIIEKGLILEECQ